jgi:hypothetical protein
MTSVVWSEGLESWASVIAATACQCPKPGYATQRRITMVCQQLQGNANTARSADVSLRWQMKADAVGNEVIRLAVKSVVLVALLKVFVLLKW